MRCCAAVCLWLLLAGTPLHPAGADESSALAAGPEAVVAEVVDGDTVVLAELVAGADQVRLVGLQAPKLALGREGFKEWPLAAEAKAALDALVKGRRVRLSYGGTRMDRHGRHLAHLHRVDGGTWIQGSMLDAGWARALEIGARDARRGIWGHRFYAVRRHDRLDRLIGTFQLVEGRVVDAASVKGRVYLNFGPEWRTDFTVTVVRPALALFNDVGLDPLALAGARLRVRGWIKRRNGAMIDVSHPEQIELLTR